MWHDPSIEFPVDRAANGLESLGLPVGRFDEIDSTNAFARRLVAAGRAVGPRFIVARTQREGYGRQGRPWHSPAGGLWFTLLTEAPTDHDEAGPPGLADMGLRVGVACLSAITEALRFSGASEEQVQHVRLKWPNDVLIGGGKVCGSLCEIVSGPHGSHPTIPTPSWLVIGVGINANVNPDSLPGGLRRPAASLSQFVGRSVDPAHLERVLGQGLLGASGRSLPWKSVVEAAACNLAGLDGEISLRLPTGQTVRGLLRGLSNLGDPVLLVSGHRFLAPPGAETL